MQHTRRASAELEQTLARLADEHVIELELDDLSDLLVAPDLGPFEARRSPFRAGIEEVVLTLAAAEQLPDELTVRVVLPDGHRAGVPIEVAEAALHARAADLTSESWREAMGIRSMGRHQLPLGIGIGIGAALVAYIAAFFATVVDTAAARGALVVVAAIALTVAWVVGWVVVEAAILDWRLPARRAAACELLESATLEVSYDGSRVQGVTGQR